MFTRRDTLKALGIGALASVAGAPGLSFAQAATQRRLVFIFLRGGLDGLSAVAPYADPAYGRARPELAVPVAAGGGSALKLDGLFALHPQLANVHAMYRAGECAVLHAVASPCRERSHFDAQNILENGTARAHARKAGWLNLALESIGATDIARGGIALANTVPFVLRGPAPVGTWSPSVPPSPGPDLLMRLADPYRHDPLLNAAFVAAQGTMRTAQCAPGEVRPMGRNRGSSQPFSAVAKAAGTFLSKPDGARVATIDMGGWDTHANQGTESGPLHRNLAQLDRGLADLKSTLGPAWNHTAVLVVTEFGRTVAMNGSGGTDHGTGGAAFLLGGAVRGGKVFADWPGLKQSALYRGRDLQPTIDLRSLFKAALIAQLHVPECALETKIFPDTRQSRPIEGLFT